MTEATCIGVPVVVEFNESTLAQEVVRRVVRRAIFEVFFRLLSLCGCRGKE